MIKANSNVSVSTEQLEMSGIPLGVPIGVWFDSDPNSVVVKYPSRFIKLSKSSAYNTGKLASQAAVTADETTFYTATISDSGSPLNGQSVTLINSVENTTGGVTLTPSFMGAGEVSQIRRVNRQQSHFHNIKTSNGIDVDVANTDTAINQGLGVAGIANGGAGISIGSGFSVRGLRPDNNGYGNPRVDKVNEPNSTSAVWYMRII